MEEKPGAPPNEEIKKPKPSNEEKPFFSYRELDLLEVVEIDKVNYLSFLVNFDYIVLIKEWDYYSYLQYIFNEIKYIQMEGDTCTCDVCNFEFDLIEENKEFKFFSVTENGDKEETKYIKVYAAFNLIENTSVGLHTGEEHNTL